jgi:hypothetical protein
MVSIVCLTPLNVFIIKELRKLRGGSKTSGNSMELRSLAQCCDFRGLRRLFSFWILGVFVLLITLTSQAQQSPPQRRADQLVQQGNYDQAIASYREALAVDPNSYDAYLGLAIAQFYKGAYPEAQGGFLLCTRLQPRRVEAYLWQAKTAEAQAQPGQALDAYQAALVLQPQNEQALQALARLQHEGSGMKVAAGSNVSEPFNYWQFYCLSLALTGVTFLVLHRKLPPSDAARGELAESVIGAFGAMAGDHFGDDDLSRAGRWYARRHFLKSFGAFKTQRRGLLVLAAVIGAGVAWLCFEKLVWQVSPDAAWIIGALVGGYFLWNLRWTFN